MAVKPTNVIIRNDLTAYAFAQMQDMQKIMDLANILSPVVPTGSTNGRYNKFESTMAFKNYASSRRAVGGQANSIGFLSDTANYNAEPYGLRISIDSHERAAAGEGLNLMELAKTRVLTVNCLTSYLANVLTVIKASVSASAGKGSWNNAEVDPIKEINDQIKAMYLATGMVANNVVIDFGAYCVLSGHPLVADRMPGAELAIVNPERIQALLVNPNCKVTIAESAVLTGGGLGNSSATMTSVMGGSVLIFYSSQMATPYDPSFCKTFAPASSLFTTVRTYREEPHLDWYENDWTCDTQVVASGLCKRIDVTGAND